ncbi:formate/nitrite transporter [Marvinbryantia formatexigens DSM 14469]|uniref:Formate/nitrite transporter n=1 Tax=Marvinbryantia formatexigens DSM 14469 TaxID=478749 RepID=C6LFP3_9FIRM|nr:formate/nitrite transporter family protein [Marvinbryantia formatexigens]EET60628.1 formate/nitrite transporter [Marvinbryantia formatexigens DSM 14469]UWO25614.1 formate/nitrite transporter family protein [Marvinbryantia formatexigens DSM 14469]SDG17470.1 nitrite transporter NirC [Marvinbryantia formatexigens]
MFQEDYKAASNTALAKSNFLKKNPAGYFISSMMAGLYIAFGSILMGIVGGYMTGQPAQKLVCGIIFSVGLCFVTVAGAELFTGNNFVMSVGALKKTVTWAQTAKVWVVCYLGNLVGSVVAAGIFTMTGIPGSGDVGAFFENTAVAKATGTPANLFAKAILCNILVCVAIWCGTRLKSEGAKIVMNFCCVGTFVTCGFEHSIANMTFLSVGMMNGAAVGLGGFLYNLLIVTLGNMVGGIVFVALPYYFISKEKA